MPKRFVWEKSLLPGHVIPALAPFGETVRKLPKANDSFEHVTRGIAVAEAIEALAHDVREYPDERQGHADFLHHEFNSTIRRFTIPHIAMPTPIQKLRMEKALKANIVSKAVYDRWLAHVEGKLPAQLEKRMATANKDFIPGKQFLPLIKKSQIFLDLHAEKMSGKTYTTLAEALIKAKEALEHSG